MLNYKREDFSEKIIINNITQMFNVLVSWIDQSRSTIDWTTDQSTDNQRCNHSIKTE